MVPGTWLCVYHCLFRCSLQLFLYDALQEWLRFLSEAGIGQPATVSSTIVYFCGVTCDQAPASGQNDTELKYMCLLRGKMIQECHWPRCWPSSPWLFSFQHPNGKSNLLLQYISCKQSIIPDMSCMVDDTMATCGKKHDAIETLYECFNILKFLKYSNIVDDKNTLEWKATGAFTS